MRCRSPPRSSRLISGGDEPRSSRLARSRRRAIIADGTQFGSQTRRSAVKIAKVAIVAAVVALIAAACGTGSEGGGGGGEDSGTLKIGVATAQTGFLAPYDQPSLRGFRMK